MMKKWLLILLLGILGSRTVYGQEVPIQNYAVNSSGRVQLTVNSSPDKYYVLRVKHHPDSAFALSTSITIGQAGTTVITEPLKAYPLDQYQVLEYELSNPVDSDGDGINDIVEYNGMPLKAPFNNAEELAAQHALTSLKTYADFQIVSTTENDAPWLEYLNDMEFVKFFIYDYFSDEPKIYFINSDTYSLHADFANYIDEDFLAPTVRKGQIIYQPHALSANGTLGVFCFNFSNNEAQDFEIVQKTQELLAANMPYLNNNFSYFITANNEQDYQDNITLYQNSRVPVVFESDVYAGITYWGLHQAEGYGFFRQMAPGDVPDAKDIVLYDALPNSLPRVGGIISSVIQTPLSHVNLRAIHDNVPNAFIRNPLDIDTIAALLNHYIYFKRNESDYEIREATLEEVNAWFENKRPTTEQHPPLNLTYEHYLPLDDISFGMYDGFGAKVANVATMRTFGFPDGTVPNGYGIPFYYYQQFMEFNGFFAQVEQMLQAPDFIADRTVRDARLELLREDIEDASMPSWMMDQLSDLQNSFPAGTSIRCRSSTNNEDLPGFSGAGLYDSKTHRIDEGHISKTIKEVFASLWNLRAFEERQFYRVNHFETSMGVLCHPNFDDEKVNGVGVSADPMYGTDSTHYWNSQLGEELITNPQSTYPEELLVKLNPDNTKTYSVIQLSSLIDEDTLLMTEPQRNLLYDYLTIIHNEFAVLYGGVGNPTFGMDIEYKIDSTNRLVIKQARPWVSYEPTVIAKAGSNCEFYVYPNPADQSISLNCDDCGVTEVRIFDLNGRKVHESFMNPENYVLQPIAIDALSNGVYLVSGSMNNAVCRTVKLVKR